MKELKFLFLLFTILISTSCVSQDITKVNEEKNILSITAGGTPTTLGITYERILNNRKVSLEIGTGLLLGGGLGINFYPIRTIEKEQFNPFIGVRSSYNIQGSGGSRIVNYLPVGINYLSSKKLYLCLDFGPAYIVQLVPNGYLIWDLPQPNYPEYSFNVYGGFKVGFAF